MGKIVETHENGNVILKYELDLVDEIDTTAAEKLSKESIHGVAPIKLNDDKTISAIATDYPSLVNFSKKERNKADVLRLMDGLVKSFSIGPKGIQISYIVKDPSKIFVNPETLEVICVAIPVKKEAIAVKDIADFFRGILAGLKFDPADRDNYVARLFNEINGFNFSLMGFGNAVKQMMSEAGVREFVPQKTPAAQAVNPGKINRMELMRNRAQQAPYGQPQFGQPQFGQPGMPPQGQAPMGQPQFGQPQFGQPGMPPQGPQNQMPKPPVAPMPPQGQAPMGQPQFGQPGMKPQAPQNQMPKPPVAPVPPQGGQPVAAQAPLTGPQVPQGQAPQNQMPKPPVAPVPPQNQMPKPPVAPVPPQGGQPVAPQAPKMPEAPKAPLTGPQIPQGQAPQNQMPKPPVAPVPPQGGQPVAPQAPKIPEAPLTGPQVPQGQAPQNQMPKPPVAPVPPQGGQPVAAQAPKMPEAPKAAEKVESVTEKAVEKAAANSFDDIMKDMDKDSFSFIDDSDFQKIPPQMMKKPQTPAQQTPAQQKPVAQAPAQDPGVPQVLMEAAEKVEAEKRARREAASAAAAAAAAGPINKEPVEDVTSLVKDSGVSGNKIVPRFIRSKTGENIYITKPEFVIGKSKLHADYAIENNTAVSREHCIVTREPNGANYIVDNKSTNGTYVNGARIEAGKKQLLTDGTKVKLGDEEFVFRLRSGD